jgi:hypothetical protein
MQKDKAATQEALKMQREFAKEAKEAFLDFLEELSFKRTDWRKFADMNKWAIGDVDDILDAAAACKDRYLMKRTPTLKWTSNKFNRQGEPAEIDAFWPSESSSSSKGASVSVSSSTSSAGMLIFSLVAH